MGKPTVVASLGKSRHYRGKKERERLSLETVNKSTTTVATAKNNSIDMKTKDGQTKTRKTDQTLKRTDSGIFRLKVAGTTQPMLLGIVMRCQNQKMNAKYVSV